MKMVVMENMMITTYAIFAEAIRVSFTSAMDV